MTSQQSQITKPHPTGLEQAQDLVQFGLGALVERWQFGREYSQREFLTVRNTWGGGMLALHDAQLLTEQQDLQGLVALRATAEGE